MRWIIALVVIGALGGGAWMVGNRAEATATPDAAQIQATAGEATGCCPMEAAKAKDQCPEGMSCPPGESCPAK
jgi:hypothetical protein